MLIALADAFHRLHQRQELGEALVEAVSPGGDTDTNAAIAGALPGAAHGRGAIPAHWRRAVLSCRAVPARDGHHPRPCTCRPDDALDLAGALLAAGMG